MRALTKVHPSAYSVLRRLSQDPSSTLVIFSGSGRARLEEVFGDMPVWLVAENGVFVRQVLVLMQGSLVTVSVCPAVRVATPLTGPPRAGPGWWAAWPTGSGSRWSTR